MVEIYLSNEWGNVCFSDSGFDSSAADSVCRQMGYTNAMTYQGTSSASTETVWLKELMCGKISHDCVNCCANFVVPDSPISCQSGVYAQVQCTFDVSKDASAGSEAVCSLGCSSGSSSVMLFVSIAVVLVLFVIAVLLILVCICCLVPACYLFKWRKGKLAGYSSDF